MCAAWCKGFHPETVLERIAPLANVVEGKVSFSIGFELFDYEDILAEHIELPRLIPRAAYRGVVWGAMVECARAKDFSPKTFISEVSTREGNYLKTPVAKYYLFTSISLRGWENLKAPPLNGCVFRFFPGLPSTIDRSGIEPQLRHLFRNRKLPTDYTHVRVAIKGRSPGEAGVAAITALTNLRGLWNFQVNLTKGTRQFSGRPQPGNFILPGPFYTIHHRDGRLASTDYWFEPTYAEPARTFPVSELEPRRRNENWIVKKLRRHKYRDDLEASLRRYCTALDSEDYDVTVLQLWALLERLTATQYMKYDALVRRVAFLYKDSEFQELVLEHIRRYRNRAIHAGHSSEARNTIMHQARTYVQELFLYHLRNGIGGRSIDETARLLDEPRDLKILRGKRRLVARAIAFRGG